MHPARDHHLPIDPEAYRHAAPPKGRIIVIASFHDKEGTPMTRPFNLIEIGPRQKQNLQFVGPQGSVRGAIYVGEETY